MSWRGVTDSIMTTCRDTFGEEIIYQGRGGSPISMRGIYEEASQLSEFSGEISIEGFVAMVDFVTRDLSFQPTRSDLIVVTRIHKNYKIIKTEFDGWSRHRLYLKEIA